MNLYNAQSLAQVFQTFFSKFGSGAIGLHDGTCLHLNPEYLSDYGTLPQALEVTQKYLKLQPGQVAIVNDPYSGGNILSTVTLILCVETQGPKPTPLLIALRKPLRPHLRHVTNVEEEGLRIPPTLIGSKNEIFEDILSAISNHPLCPDEFTRNINTWFQELKKAEKNLLLSLKMRNFNLSRTFFQSYLTSCYQMMRSHIEDLPLGEVIESFKLDGDESLQLNILSRGGEITFEFQASNPSKRYNLTDSATFGTCLAALLAYFEKPLVLNSGSFRAIKVNTPSLSWLSAKYPSPTFLGMSSGIHGVASSILHTLCTLGQENSIGTSATIAPIIDLEFQSGAHFFDTVYGGSGGTPNEPGQVGINFWERNKLSPSIEDLENRFPMIVDRITLRKSTGGSGENPGGSGVAKTFRVFEPATMKWSGDNLKIRPSGANGGMSGTETEFNLKPSGKKSEKLNSFGSLPLNIGDTITIKSAGGGGWGKEKAQE